MAVKVTVRFGNLKDSVRLPSTEHDDKALECLSCYAAVDPSEPQCGNCGHRYAIIAR